MRKASEITATAKAAASTKVKPVAGDAGSQSPPRPEAFVDAASAGEFLSLRPRRVLELARQGVIPAYPLGTGSRRVWRFRLSEVAAALRSSSVDYLRQSPAPRQETT